MELTTPNLYKRFYL